MQFVCTRQRTQDSNVHKPRDHPSQRPPTAAFEEWSSETIWLPTSNLARVS